MAIFGKIPLIGVSWSLLIERFHSHDQYLSKFIGTKGSIYIRKEFNSHRTGLENQHSRPFIVLEHQYGRRDVMWKQSLPKLPSRKPISMHNTSNFKSSFSWKWFCSLKAPLCPFYYITALTLLSIEWQWPAVIKKANSTPRVYTVHVPNQIKETTK